jgi:hypothetical protein
VLLKILGGLLALAVGLWLGKPGRYERPQAEVDQALGRSGPRHYTKRSFTPLDLLRKKTRASNRAGTFQLEDPDAPPADLDEPRVSLSRARRQR